MSRTGIQPVPSQRRHRRFGILVRAALLLLIAALGPRPAVAGSVSVLLSLLRSLPADSTAAR
jgi:hypothetical protein